MRISDWSSDVCSSDLHRRADGAGGAKDHKTVTRDNAHCPAPGILPPEKPVILPRSGSARTASTSGMASMVNGMDSRAESPTASQNETSNHRLRTKDVMRALRKGQARPWCLHPGIRVRVRHVESAFGLGASTVTGVRQEARTFELQSIM